MADALIGKELTLTVPFAAATIFPQLFPRFDELRGKEVEEWVFTICSLEEVFGALAATEDPEARARAILSPPGPHGA